MLPPDQRRVIEQIELVCSLLGEAFKKQTKAIEEHRKQLTESNYRLKFQCLLIDLRALIGPYSKFC